MSDLREQVHSRLPFTEKSEARSTKKRERQVKHENWALGKAHSQLPFFSKTAAVCWDVPMSYSPGGKGPWLPSHGSCPSHTLCRPEWSGEGPPACTARQHRTHQAEKRKGRYYRCSRGTECRTGQWVWLVHMSLHLRLASEPDKVDIISTSQVRKMRITEGNKLMWAPELVWGGAGTWT